MKYFSPHSMLQVPCSHTPKATPTSTGPWTSDEHARFLAAIEALPQGPWKAIAKDIGTRTPRQVQTHAQKYREKLFRQSKTPTKKAKAALKYDQKCIEATPSCDTSDDDASSLSMDDAMEFLVQLVADSSNWDLPDEPWAA
ncbi:hypothetical protein H257_07270 [Aphanomyces astaci]|uniref:Uncharacterized protein n=1 Tax=Aphanomyces astaci TaxID=112090 RepID=W4GHQ6_APHAT|nr:hypothetical protein H257_07270 [Aphanomyces astaci]ETV79197.1 hypothetical protein H257_07270 [Aphanomyces astaci]|eukprot:XP_009831038.1 hypothetical protein H257_07270 [Aphanomyces astaci]